VLAMLRGHVVELYAQPDPGVFYYHQRGSRASHVCDTADLLKSNSSIKVNCALRCIRRKLQHRRPPARPQAPTKGD